MDSTDFWHVVWSRHYDHRKAGHRIRAAVWGWAADRIINLIDLARKVKHNAY